MFDMSWGEIMVIGGVALIVIGPKDLPKALRTVGQMTTKVRRLAGEFQSQFSEAMREAELEEVKKEVEGLQRDVGAGSGGFNPLQTIRDELKGAVEKPVASSTSADWTPTTPLYPAEPEWTPLPEPPAAPEPARGEGWSEYGPGPSSSPAPAETAAPAYIDPEARPALLPEPAGDATVQAPPAPLEKRS